MQSAQEYNDEKKLTPFRRWSGLYTLGLIVLLLIFFAIHQLKKTGFFTSRFQATEMVALYLPIIISMLAPILRVLQGRNDPARLMETISDVCLVVGSIWLWNTFPFNFANFAAVFPPDIRFAFTWINDNLGRFLLLLQIAIGSISAFSSFGSYLMERRKRPSEDKL